MASTLSVTQLELSTRFRAVRHLIREAASEHGLEFELLQAVIATESGFDPGAVSPKGAVGLMQVMPDTAERFGVRPVGKQSVSERLTDPRTNIQAGARYLAWLIGTFGGDVRLAVAAYNAGEGAVLKAGRQVPNYPETIDYVRKVTNLHYSLKPPRAVSQARSETLPQTLPPRPPGRV
jgi:soluble lytic murein transglycosylase-like protein